MISTDEVRKLAELSRLEVTENEISKLQGEFGTLLAHMDSLKDLDLEGVEPLTVVDENTGILREDTAKPSLSQEKAFLNSKTVEEGHFTIPKTIG